MYFLYPLFLWLLIVPLFFLFYSFKARKRGFEKHFSPQMLKKLTLHSSILSSRIKQHLFLLALALFIVALARPVQPRENTQTSLSKTSVIVAVDASKSMHQTDIYPSRYQLALQKLKDFVAQAKGFNLGILFYAKDAYMLYPLSQDITALHTLVKDIN
ncbi:MAG TPA: VWA domain-containing protein, partial [Epsilonproteobacteria bacterium]|nr:VWA domain-containing protein [Campylobacterota bacterium]